MANRGCKRSKISIDEKHTDLPKKLPSDAVINVEFEAYPLIESDFCGIQSLLQQKFVQADIDLKELSNLLLDQQNIGCVFKPGVPELDDDDSDSDEDDIFGVVSVINISKSKTSNAIQQLLTVLRSKCSDQQVWKSFELALSSKNVGLLISERFINIPHHIALPSYQSLIKDIAKSGYVFDNFILISKIHKQASAEQKDGSGLQSGRSGKQHKKKNGRETEVGDVLYSNAEEELVAEHCESFFDYPVDKSADATIDWDDADDVALKPFRRVFLLSNQQFDAFIGSLSRECDA